MYRPRLQGEIPMWWLCHTLVPEAHWLLDTVWAEDRALASNGLPRPWGPGLGL